MLTEKQVMLFCVSGKILAYKQTSAGHFNLNSKCENNRLK